MAKERIHVIISILAMLSVFTTTEAVLWDTCTTVGDCVYNGATCEGGQCGCNTTGGYRVEGKQCLPNLLNVSVTPSGPVQLPYNTTLTPALVATVTNGSNTTQAQEVRWRKISSGNVETIDISSSKYSGSTDVLSNPQLVINNAVFGDEAEYQCQARNAEGWGASNKVSVDVTGDLLSVSVTPIGPVQLPYGTTLTPALMATVTNGSNTQPTQEVRWRKISNGNEVTINTSSSKYSGSTLLPNPQLVINNAVFGDEAEYQCQARNAEGWGSSNKVSVDVIGGVLTVTIGPDVTGKIGESVTISCTVTGPEVSKITWKKGGTDIPIDGTRYSGSTTDSPSLIINNLITKEANQYQCTASNPGGTYTSPRNAKLTVMNRQFQDVCSASLPCDDSRELECSQSTGRCVCKGTFYHNNNVCYSRDKIKVTITSHFSSTSTFSVSWNPPSNDVKLVSGYIVRWRIHDQAVSTQQSQTVDKSVTSDSVSTGLIPGQLYIVTVTSSVILTNPASNIEVHSDVKFIRIVPLPPGSILDSSDFTPDKLMLSWTPPINGTMVTKYDVAIDGTTQSTVNRNSNIQFTKQLIPGTKYNVSIVTVSGQNTNNNEEKRSVAYTEVIRTIPTISTPPTALAIGTPNSRGFPVSFSVPNDVKGQLAGYRILISDDSKCWQQIKIICDSCAEFANASQNCTTSTVYRVPDIMAVTQNYNVTGLHPYINYTVEVAAINGAGVGNYDDETTMTEEEVPQKPSISTIAPKSDKEVDLTWTLASPSPGNVTYIVTVMEAEDNTSDVFINKREIQYNGFQHTVKVIDGLEEFWRYKFTVKAATIKGSQTSEESTVVRTNQGVPGKVRDLTVVRKPTTYRAALVQWKVPLLRDQNGILVNYTFTSNATGSSDKLVPVDTTEQFVTEEDIVVVPEMTYSIEIYAINSEDTIGEKETFIYSAGAGPPPRIPDEDIVRTTPGQHSTSLTTIEIDLNTYFFTNKTNGEPVYFGIAVCASCGNFNFAGNEQQDYKDLPSWSTARTRGFPLYRVTNETYMEEVKNSTTGRRKRSTEVQFIIGEDNTCEAQGSNVYCNGPLSPGLSYTVIIFVCTNGGCTQSGNIGPFATLKVVVLVLEDSSSIGGILVGVVSVVVAVFVIAVAMFIVSRRRGESKQDSKTYADLTLHDRAKSDQTYSALNQRTRIQREKPIPLHSFVDHVFDLMRDSGLKICNEFSELLRSKETSTTTKGTLKINVNRNRGSVVPYDFNRVQLQKKRDGSDYVNASFVLNQSYIMTQYPLRKTAVHFWRMVWERNCPLIVALTVDDGKYKKEWYFPASDGAVRTVGGIDVELVATFDVLEKVTLRKIKLSKGKQLKNVNHIHAYGLGMVNISDQLLHSINLVAANNTNIQSKGPFVVHGGCVGINYSGMFVLVDYLVKLIESGVNRIDVYGSTFTIMSERMDALITEEQYAVIYMFLKRYINDKSRPGKHLSNFNIKDTARSYEYVP